MCRQGSPCGNTKILYARKDLLSQSFATRPRRNPWKPVLVAIRLNSFVRQCNVHKVTISHWYAIRQKDPQLVQGSAAIALCRRPLTRSIMFLTGKRRRFGSFTSLGKGIRTPTNERTVPNVKFHLFGTIGAKFTVKPGRYRRQQTVFSTRLGFVHRHRFVCHRRCGSGNGLSSGMLWVI